MPAWIAAFFLGLKLLPEGQAAAAPVRPDGAGEAPRSLRYLVAPFENRSGSPGLSFLSSGLGSTLAEKLETHPDLLPAYGPQILGGMASGQPDLAQALRRAEETAARWLFSGWYTRVGWRYQVGLSLHQVEGGSVRLIAESESPKLGGNAGVILDALDQALLPLLQRSGLSIDDGQRAQLMRRPTTDHYAFTLYGRALHLYYQGEGRGVPPDLERVRKTLQRACFIDPKFAEARRMLGLVNLEMGHADRAMAQYAHALDLRPEYFAALLGLGRQHQLLGNHARALEILERARRVRPAETEVRLWIGEILWEMGRLAEAQAELVRVTVERPESVPARRLLSMVYAARGLIDELAAELLRLSSLQPEDTEVRFDLAAAYSRLGRYRQAAAVYEEILRKRPRHAQAYRLLGDLYRKLDEPDRAAAMYQKMLRLLPDDPRPYFLLGSTYAAMGQHHKAEQAFIDAQHARHFLTDAWGNLGALALLREELGRAGWYLSRAAARPGSSAKVHYNYALALDRMNQRERALAELRVAADLDPDDPEVHFALGVMHLKQGDEEQAARSFEEVLRRQPDHGAARHNLGLLKGK